MQRQIIDKEKIIERINDIANATAELKKFQKMSLERFLSDKDNFPLASYWLRISLEAVLTIGTHILARLPGNGKKKDYTQTILSLADYQVIPNKFAKKVKGMAGYRNRLVHLYWQITPKEILSIIKNDLEDFDEFIKYIEKFIAKIKPK